MRMLNCLRFAGSVFFVYVVGIAIIADGAEQAVTDAETEVIEEVIVTAQKREQDPDEIGIAIAVLAGDAVRELGLRQPVDLAAQISNLNINDTFTNSVVNVSIRGVGLNDYAVNNNTAAGIYVDGVYLVSPAMLGFQLFDLERVEVLKGPQGTLYGRNTTAGAVNFISRKPSDLFTANLSVNAGNFDFLSLEGAVGGKLLTGLAGRAALQVTRQGEGHQTNRATGKDVGQVDRFSWRGLIDWQVSDTVDLTLKLHGGYDKSDTWLIKVDNSFTTDDDAFFSSDPFSSAGREDTFLDVESVGASLIIHWSISENLLFTSLTGYEDYSRRHVEDRDGTAMIHLDGDFHNDIRQVSQEVLFTYSGVDTLIIAGIFYENDEVDTRDIFNIFELGLGFYSLGNEYIQETDSAALFLHTEWQLSSGWRLTAGLRYTDEKKEFRDAFAFAYSDAYPSEGGTETQLFTPVNNDYDVTDLSGKIGIDYIGFNNAILYASVSKGFKSGNFQGQLTTNANDLASFDEENLIAYEIGFKGRLLDNMQFNAAAFFYDYEDIQIYGPHFQHPTLGMLFGILNAGDAEILGAEFDVAWRLSRECDVRLGLGLLDTEITRSVLDFVTEGSELPNSPRINFNVNVKYSRSIAENWTLQAIFDSHYKDDVTYDIVRSPSAAEEEGYWLLNLRLGAVTGGWGLYVWAKNLTDESYRTQVLISTVGHGETWGFPRTYGVTVDYAFGL